MHGRRLLILGLVAGLMPFAAAGPIATACPLHHGHHAAIKRAAIVTVTDGRPRGSAFFDFGRSAAFAP